MCAVIGKVIGAKWNHLGYACKVQPLGHIFGSTASQFIHCTECTPGKIYTAVHNSVYNIYIYIYLHCYMIYSVFIICTYYNVYYTTFSCMYHEFYTKCSIYHHYNIQSILLLWFRKGNGAVRIVKPPRSLSTILYRGIHLFLSLSVILHKDSDIYGIIK